MLLVIVTETPQHALSCAFNMLWDSEISKSNINVQVVFPLLLLGKYFC